VRKKLHVIIMTMMVAASLLCGCSNIGFQQTTTALKSLDSTQQESKEKGITESVSENTPLNVPQAIDGLNISDLSKQELMSSFELGMPMDRVAQETLSGEELTELLDWFVSYAAPEKIDEWKSRYPELRKSKDNIRRMDAMAALYLAAQLVGGSFSDNQLNVWEHHRSVNPDWNAEDSGLTDSLFGEAANDEYYCDTIGNCHLVDGGFYYNMARKSNYSCQNPFSFDSQSCTYMLGEPLTFADGILAVFRLISSSDMIDFKREPTKEELKYVTMADKRREDINAAQTDVSGNVTGTIYYVSNNGSDNNNGRTPETAWATPKYALQQSLAPGDAVLLERGSVWTIQPSDAFGLTSSAYLIPKGVTLGAYGNGDKPILQGSSESADNPGFWELFFEEDGIKIWKAAEKVYYCPVIVFNDGESYAYPVMPGMDEKGMYRTVNGNPFDVREGLEEDLQFCCLLDLSQKGVDTVIDNDPVKGALYLRCDAGNPGDVYKKISIPQTACGLALLTDAAIDGIKLRYFSCNGAVMDGYDGNHSQTVTNCDVGWCGGLLMGYNESEGGMYLPFSAGGAMQISSTHVTVQDSYIHDCGPFTLIAAFHNNADTPEKCILRFEDILIEGNLIARCGSGVHMGDYATMDIQDTYGFMSNFVFEDNMVMDSGFGWVGKMVSGQSATSNVRYSAFENYDSAADNDGIYLRNNIFYKSAYALFSLSEYRLYKTEKAGPLPVFSGNTYIQYGTNPLLRKNDYSEVYYPSSETMINIIGDKNGTLLVIE